MAFSALHGLKRPQEASIANPIIAGIYMQGTSDRPLHNTSVLFPCNLSHRTLLLTTLANQFVGTGVNVQCWLVTRESAFRLASTAFLTGPPSTLSPDTVLTFAATCADSRASSCGLMTNHANAANETAIAPILRNLRKLLGDELVCKSQTHTAPGAVSQLIGSGAETCCDREDGCDHDGCVRCVEGCDTETVAFAAATRRASACIMSDKHRFLLALAVIYLSEKIVVVHIEPPPRQQFTLSFRRLTKSAPSAPAINAHPLFAFHK